LLKLAAAVAILAPLSFAAPAQAAPEHPLTDITQQVISFFGFGPDQANNPTDPQPVAERPKAELTPREIAPTPVTSVDAAPPRLPVVAAVAAPSTASHPVEEAVMVFAGSPRLKRGHVAVVTEIVSPREIIVDQANWQNKGEIDHATPVLDVSRANDWSQVRVWDIPSGTFGSRVYRISGFIAKGLETASRD
jgi:hypothetical protein